MTPRIMDLGIPADPGTAETAAGAFPLAKLLGVIVVFGAPATGAVTVSLKRAAHEIILGVATLSGATTVRVAFDSPVVLLGHDQIKVDASATGAGAIAWVEYEA
jgi:hypothetical protein